MQNKAPFPLRPIKSATVSVISEATASAAVPNNEKINFHIGNPLQDDRLVDRYFEICTGYSTDIFENPVKFEIDDDFLGKLKFLYNTIENAVPYTHSGGYSSKKPPVIINELQKYWSKINSILVRFGKGYGTSKKRENEILEEIIDLPK